jgi:hypothetical protein
MCKLTSQQTTRSRGTKDEKSEPAYLFGVGLSSLKRHARAWSLPSSTEGKDNRRVEMAVVVLLYRTDLPYGVETRPGCLRT